MQIRKHIHIIGSTAFFESLLRLGWILPSAAKTLPPLVIFCRGLNGGTLITAKVISPSGRILSVSALHLDTTVLETSSGQSETKASSSRACRASLGSLSESNCANITMICGGAVQAVRNHVYGEYIYTFSSSRVEYRV